MSQLDDVHPGTTPLLALLILALMLPGLALADDHEVGEESDEVAEDGEDDTESADGEQPDLNEAEGDDAEDLEDIEDFDLEALLEAPVVESGAKRAQSLDEAPAAISVIDQKRLTGSGEWQLSSLLRHVVGVHVSQTNTNRNEVGMRGFSSLTNNRVALMIDGRRSVDASVGRGLWELLPHPGDIEQVEVLRGPGSTLFGANAFSGVISVKTKRPIDHAGVEGEAFAGMAGVDASDRTDLTGSMQISGGGHGYAAAGWANEDETLGARMSFGFNAMPEQQPVDFTTIRSSGAFGYYLRGAFETRPTEDVDVLLQVSHALSEVDISASTQIAARPSQTSEQAAQLSLVVRDLFTEGLTLRTDVDGARVVNAISSQAEDRVITEEPEVLRGHGLLQLDLELLEGHNITSLGGELTYQKTNDFFDFSPTSLYFGGFLQNESRFFADKSLLLNLGMRLEQINNSDGEGVDPIYRNISPRAALVWKFTEDNNIRLSASTAFRTPTAFETNIDVLFTALLPDGAPETVVLLSNPSIEPEVVRQVELGYRGTLLDAIRIDSSFFLQQIRGGIDLRPQDTLPRVWDNVLDLDQLGLELDVTLASTNWVTTFLTYAFTYTVDADTGNVFRGFPQHLAGLRLVFNLPSAVTIDLDTHVTAGFAPRLFASSPVLGFVLTEREQPVVTRIDARVSKSLFDGAIEVSVIGRNLLGFFRDSDDLREYPSEVMHPIGGTLMLGVTVLSVE